MPEKKNRFLSADQRIILLKKWNEARARAKAAQAEHHRMDQVLRESEIRYRSLFENLFDGLLLSEPGGAILSANPQACRMLRMSESEIIQAGRAGIIVADAKLSSALLERSQTGQVLTELTFRRKDGSTFHGEVSSRVFTDADGSLKNSVVFRDISSRKAIENALRISEEKFANAFYHSPTLLSIHRLQDACIIEANQAFLNAFGFTREEAINHSTSELGLWANPADRESFMAIYRQGVKHIPVSELYGRNRNQELVLLTGSFNIIQIEGKDFVLSVLENVTERRRTEQALRESEARFQTLVEQAPVAIMISRDGMPIYANQSLIRMIGFPDLAVALQQPIIDYFAPEEKAIRALVQRQIDEQPASLELDTILLHADGSRFPAHLSIATIQLSAGPAHVSFIFDITERKQAEAQIADSLKQLHALSAHLQTIREDERAHIAREIHDELGQALTGIKMDLFWIKNRFDKSEGLSDARPIMNKLSSLLLETDSTIDAVRRISTDLRPSILDTLGLVAAIEWLASDFQARSGIPCLLKTSLKSLNLSQDFSTALFRICQEALTNVARHAQAKRVIVQLKVQDSNLILAVEDNGKGITEEEIRQPGSLGILGMKERAFSFHGRVDLQRTANGGTCVTACFPNPPIDSDRE